MDFNISKKCIALLVICKVQTMLKCFLVNFKESTYIHVNDHLWTFAVDLLMIYFISKVNTCHLSIKLSYKYSENSIDFLDARTKSNIEF